MRISVTPRFDALKTPAHKATWSRFRELAERVEWLDGLGDTVAWTAGVAPAKAAASFESDSRGSLMTRDAVTNISHKGVSPALRENGL